MGLSASQCRLLCLTSKLSDLEYQAQVIDNAKINLDNLSSAASTDYENALEKQKLTVFNSNTNAYVDASAKNLTTYGAISSTDKQRIITDASGRVIISTTMASNYTSAQIDAYSCQNFDYLAAGPSGQIGDTDGDKKISLDEFLSEMGVTKDSNGSYIWDSRTNKTATTYPAGCNTTEQQTSFMNELVAYYTNKYEGKESFVNLQKDSDGKQYTSATANVQEYLKTNYGVDMSKTYTYDSAAATAYGNTFEQINKHGYNSVSDECLQSGEWLEQQIESGNLFLEEYNNTAGTNGTGDWEQVNWQTGDSTLKTVNDTSALQKAEARYETKMKEIQHQDKKYDLLLDRIDTEHSAVQTEIDSVKSIVGKNIERSYKTFSA